MKPARVKRLLLGLGGFLTLALLLFSMLWANRQVPEQTAAPDTAAEQAGYLLSGDEEARIKEFVKSFVNLYNTFRYADYRNLTATGDYQTPAFQERTVAYVAELERTTSPGYSRVTEVDASTFTYRYPSARRLETQVRATVTEHRGQPGGLDVRSTPLERTFSVTASVTLSRSGGRWFVDGISFSEQ